MSRSKYPCSCQKISVTLEINNSKFIPACAENTVYTGREQRLQRTISKSDIQITSKKNWYMMLLEKEYSFFQILVQVPRDTASFSPLVLYHMMIF